MIEYPTDFSTLIPELPAWNNGSGIDPESWVGCVGSFEIATAYSLVFWPRFVLFEDYVLRHGFSEDALRGFEEQEAGDRCAIEGVMNHLHIADIQYFGAPATETQLRYLGRILKDIYETKLVRDFPDRHFTVTFNDEPDLDLLAYQMTFWQR